MIDEMDEVIVPFLDVRVTPVLADEVASLVTQRPEVPRLILNHNLHSAYLYRKHQWFRDFYSRADLVVIDGWPVLALCSSPRKLSSAYRIGSTDWISALWNGPDQDPLRIFLLGAQHQTNETALIRWRQARPQDVVAGRSGYMGADEESGVAEEIRDFDPHLVLVGMGMPAQEAFLVRNLEHLPPAYIATVGGAIDYMAGAVRLSPRWLGHIGLEWVWRFAHDPVRLCGRYFVEPVKLGALIVRDRLRARAVR